MAFLINPFLFSEARTATLSVTLADLTLEAVAELVAITATLTKTLDDLTLSSSGEIQNILVANLDATLDALVLEGVGVLSIEGALDQTLGALTLSSSAFTSIDGALTVTLADLTLSSSGLLTPSQSVDMKFWIEGSVFGDMPSGEEGGSKFWIEGAIFAPYN